MLNQGCTEWTRKDGQDLSDKKDFSTVQMWVMKLAYGYYFGLSDFKPQDSRHKTIRDWFQKFFQRNKRATKVYFGLDHGWFYPAILDRLRQKKSPKSLITELLYSLEDQVLDDGSMNNRTTRGNKALWYHHDALKEAVVTSEIAKTFNITITAKLRKKLSKSGEVFIKGYFDHSYLDQWAKQAHNSVFRPGEQTFRAKLNQIQNGHSWFYIFSYRNPDDPLTNRLDKLIRQESNQAVKDGQLGLGVGCIYAVAKGGQKY